MALPKGFIDLAAAYNAAPNTFVNVIGVVIDVQQPTMARSGQYMLTFKLLDERLRDSVYGQQGLAVRFFKVDLQSLPKVQNVGDVVLLRNVKVSPFNGQPMALSNFQTNVLVFPAAKIPSPSFSISVMGTNRLQCLGVPADVDTLDLNQQAYVIRLKAELSGSIEKSQQQLQRIQQAPIGPKLDLNLTRMAPPAALQEPAAKRMKYSSFGNKFRLVEEVRHRDFADLCVQVVKKYPNQYGSCELYVTDYTANDAMWYYAAPEEEDEREREGDRFGHIGPPKKSWPGPYGWLVLKVNAKDPHAFYANREVNEGDFVLLRNVKMKIMNDNAKLEGDMWPDSINEGKILIQKLLNPELPEIRDLLGRKAKYWDTRPAHTGAAERQQEAGGEKASKAEKKKAKKQRRKAREAAEAGSEAAEPEKHDSKTNKYIRCSNEEQSLTGVREILDPDNVRHTNKLPNGQTYILPFINANYRARVRVVDFSPRSIADFAVPSLPEVQPLEPSPIDQVDWETSSSIKYEWYFSLLLEDARDEKANGTKTAQQSPRIWVHVGHEEAQYLLGNSMPDPQDLHDENNAQLLTQLREKLFILWGNLEEKRDEDALSNNAFDCCICEYGIELDEGDPEKKEVPLGWKKLFKMFGTTIL